MCIPFHLCYGIYKSLTKGLLDIRMRWNQTFQKTEVFNQIAACQKWSPECVHFQIIAQNNIVNNIYSGIWAIVLVVRKVTEGQLLSISRMQIR